MSLALIARLNEGLNGNKLLERVVHDGRRRRHEGRKELEGLLTMSLHGGVEGAAC
jgi:hypothetical protein